MFQYHWHEAFKHGRSYGYYCCLSTFCDMTASFELYDGNWEFSLFVRNWNFIEKMNEYKNKNKIMITNWGMSFCHCSLNILQIVFICYANFWSQICDYDLCFNVYQEIITSAEFHPLHCNLLAYSSSRGFIRLVDMRQSALCDHCELLCVPHGGKFYKRGEI